MPRTTLASLTVNRAYTLHAALALLALCVGCTSPTPDPPSQEGSPKPPGVELSPVQRELLARLEKDPVPPPAAPPTIYPVTLILNKDDAGNINVVGSPIATDPSTLRMDRAMMKRRTDPSEYWAFVEQDGKIVYWVPIDPSAMVRAMVTNGSDDHEPELADVPDMYVAVRVPFYFGGRVSFVANEREVGSFLSREGMETSSFLPMEGREVGSFEMEIAPAIRLENPITFDPPATLECKDVAPGWPLGEKFTVDHCPQVFEVHGGKTQHDNAFNLVFISDGFEENQLDTYRCGVAMMVEKLLSTPPYNEYSDSFRIYRIDFAASHPIEFPKKCGATDDCWVEPLMWSKQEADCKALVERTPLTAPSYGRPIYRVTHADCVRLDLDLESCPETAQECQLLWPENDGMRKMWRVAACAPAFDAVIIVANSGTLAGGGTDDIHPPVAVTTLRGIDSWSTRSTLMLHEFGHVLGLLDEYVSSQAYSGTKRQSPDFHAKRNLIRKEEGIPTHFPWEDDCTPGVAGIESYAGGKCFVSCNAQCETCDLPQLSQLTSNIFGGPKVGAYEGAFYSPCGYFKASAQCTMNHARDPMCAACTQYVEGLFEDLGMEKNAVPHSTEPPPGA